MLRNFTIGCPSRFLFTFVKLPSMPLYLSNKNNHSSTHMHIHAAAIFNNMDHMFQFYKLIAIGGKVDE